MLTRFKGEDGQIQLLDGLRPSTVAAASEMRYHERRVSRLKSQRTPRLKFITAICLYTRSRQVRKKTTSSALTSPAPHATRTPATRRKARGRDTSTSSVACTGLPTSPPASTTGGTLWLRCSFPAPRRESIAFALVFVFWLPQTGSGLRLGRLRSTLVDPISSAHSSPC